MQVYEASSIIPREAKTFRENSSWGFAILRYIFTSFAQSFHACLHISMLTDSLEIVVGIEEADYALSRQHRT